MVGRLLERFLYASNKVGRGVPLLCLVDYLFVDYLVEDVLEGIECWYLLLCDQVLVLSFAESMLQDQRDKLGAYLLDGLWLCWWRCWRRGSGPHQEL